MPNESSPSMQSDQGAGLHNKYKIVPGSQFSAASPDPSGRHLATSSERVGESGGQVVVWDVETGAMISQFSADGTAGWSPDPGLLRWSADGKRLAAGVDTNAISVLEEGEEICYLLLDDTRDSPVRFCWADTGNQLFASVVDGGETDSKGALVALGSPDDVEWLGSEVLAGVLRDAHLNLFKGSIVGVDENDNLIAFHVKSRRLLYSRPLREMGAPPYSIQSRHLEWSGDGRRLGMIGPHGIAIIDTDEGSLAGTLPIDKHIDALRFGPSNKELAIVAGPAPKTPDTLLIAIGTRLVHTISMPAARRSTSIGDIRSCIWSPGGDAMAILDQNGSTILVDPQSAQTTLRIDTGLKSEGGILWAGKDRIAALEEDSLAFWSTSGALISKLRIEASQ